MQGRSDNRQSVSWISSKLGLALAALLEAFDYAEDTQSDRWDFAVAIRHLRRIGLSPNDLRWLVKKGYVDHASEVTVRGDTGRDFRSTGDLTFTKRTCFVLTELGVSIARSVNGMPETLSGERPTDAGNGQVRRAPVVHWNAEARKLSVCGEIVKRFKWPASNQETVLSAFQEEGWPERIDDPLPPQPEQDSKRRLSDTIKCLNRKQNKPLIHFRGDGTGEGVVWELVEPNQETNGGH